MTDKQIVVKQPKQSIIPLENIAKEDINFPEFCFGLIGRIPKSKQPDELVFVDKINPNAKISIYKSRRGLPTQFTRDLRFALGRIAYRKNQFTERKVPVSGKEILEELGLTVNGKNMNILKEHFDILTGTRISFVNSYYHKESKKNADTKIEFGILQAYQLVELKDKIKGQTNDIKGYFYWNEYFWDKSMINGKNLIDIDYVLYRKLVGDITKQLYVFLNKRKFNKPELRIELAVLAFEKLGISRTRTLTKVRYDLKKSHDQLLKNNFLESLPVYSNFNEKIFITYQFNQQNRLDSDSNDIVYPTQDVTITNDLEIYGFTQGQVAKMINKYGNEQIEKTIKFYEFSAKNQKIRSPKKWILASLEKDFDTSEFDKHEQVLFESINFQQKEREAREQQKLKEIDDKRRSEESDQQIRTWIGNNSGTYAALCTEYLETLKMENPFMYKSLNEKSLKMKVSALQTLMDSKIYNTEVRSKIFSMIK